MRIAALPSAVPHGHDRGVQTPRSSTTTEPRPQPRLELTYWPIGSFVLYENNPRKHPAKKVAQLAAAITEFGFRVPILARFSDRVVVDGHLRIKAAIQAGLTELPVINADDMTPEQIRAFRLSVNRMAELAEWDEDKLLRELEAIKTDGAIELGLEGALGFDLGEVGDVPVAVEAWDMAPTKDVFVITITGSLPIEADVRERLRGLDGVTIEASVLQAA
ncbi:MAG: ParB N-terminal domain-containing protein [Polyangiaceae bacterium]|nr:ParB N-terminal domain-containing protein [Polyangiaceae bacterium]